MRRSAPDDPREDLHFRYPAEHHDGRLSEKADGGHRNLSGHGGRSLQAVSRHVEEQPHASVLIEFGVGLIGG